MNTALMLALHGGHPWIVGAAQPLLSLDHFLAGLFVAVVVSIGLTLVVRRGRVPVSRHDR